MSQKIKRKQARVPSASQWIEVTHQDGKTVSSFHPTNEELTRQLQTKQPPPQLIYRRVSFFNGVPKEYMWIQPPPYFQMHGGVWMHRMLPADWPEVMFLESLLPEHHMLPSKRPQGRPESRGLCPCEQCADARARGVNRFPKSV